MNSYHLGLLHHNLWDSVHLTDMGPGKVQGRLPDTNFTTLHGPSPTSGGPLPGGPVRRRKEGNGDSLLPGHCLPGTGRPQTMGLGHHWPHHSVGLGPHTVGRRTVGTALNRGRRGEGCRHSGGAARRLPPGTTWRRSARAAGVSTRCPEDFPCACAPLTPPVGPLRGRLRKAALWRDGTHHYHHLWEGGTLPGPPRCMEPCFS